MFVIDSFHILLGLGALAALYFLVPCESCDYKARKEANYEYDRQLPYGMEQQDVLEQIDPTDYMVIPPYPTVRRGHYYGTDYMLTKAVKNKYLAEPTPDIHFIEPDAYRKSNILELQDP